MRIWTEEAKAAQRQAIRRWQPWARSTGPKTAAGKARAARNARKGDTLPKLTRDLARLGGKQMRLFQLWDQLDRLDLTGELAAKRTIMEARISAEIGRLADETTAWFWRMMHVTWREEPDASEDATLAAWLRPPAEGNASEMRPARAAKCDAAGTGAVRFPLCAPGLAVQLIHKQKGISDVRWFDCTHSGGPAGRIRDRPLQPSRRAAPAPRQRLL